MHCDHWLQLLTDTLYYMKLITSTKQLRDTFIDLLNTYNEYHFAVAWAGMSVDIIDVLHENKKRIKQFAVGIDFCHTDPEFLMKFRKEVVVTSQKGGTYHPKVFLFYNDDKNWAIITGSPNLTTGAFYKNAEAAIMVTSFDGEVAGLLADSRKFIDSCYRSGKTLTKPEVDGYRLKWNKVRKDREKQSGLINQTDTSTWVPTDFMMYNWQEYVAEFAELKDIVESRVEMLGKIKSIFAKKHSLAKMSEQERRLIGGMPSDIDDSWADFGTNGNGKYKKKIIQSYQIYSDALDQIPLTGEVTREHYDAFLEIFLTDEHTKISWKSSAGRLLAMKRPDTFYNLTGTNKAGFCNDFGITHAHVNLNTYWELVVQRITLSEWWNTDMPHNRYERNLWETRAAMLDVLYYEDF